MDSQSRAWPALLALGAFQSLVGIMLTGGLLLFLMIGLNGFSEREGGRIMLTCLCLFVPVYLLTANAITTLIAQKVVGTTGISFWPLLLVTVPAYMLMASCAVGALTIRGYL